MPLTSEYKSKKIPSFKKKPYRPWDIPLDENINITDNILSDHLQAINIDNKETIREQLENNKETNKGTIREQLENNKEIIRKQLDNDKGTIREQLENNKVTIRKQINSQINPSNILPTESITELCGLQRKILFYIINQCILRGQLTSGLITNESLRDIGKTDVATIKTSLYRLTKKGWIIRNKGKRGKGGFVSFTVTESTRNTVLEEIKNLSFSDQLGNNKETNKVTNTSCSSSILYTTTNTLNPIQLPDEWKEIDIDPLQKIKFTQFHLEQIFKFKKLEAHIVQESIYAFAFDLQYNNKSEKLNLSPLNVFMGIMKKGNPYLPPDNYESPQDRAMRKYLERKKEEEAKRTIREKEALDYAYKEWLNSTNQEELEKLVEPKYRKEKNSRIYESFLINHFQNQLWPKLKLELINSEQEKSLC